MEEEYHDDKFYDEDINDEDIYSDEGTKELEEEDVINPEEEGFMQGYNKASKRKKRKVAA